MKRMGLFLAAVLTAGVAEAKPGLSPFLVRTQVGVEQNIGKPLPLDLRLRDENGKMVTLGSRFGKRPVIITPVYYSCPMICNVVLDQLNNRMADMKFTVGEEFDVITYSFDPKETSPEANAKRRVYVGRYGRVKTDDSWHFYTADAVTIQKLSDALGFRFMWDPKQKQYAHAAAIIVATPDGRIARYFHGMEYSARDLRLSLVEASQGKLGDALDRLMLLCYDYDPATGRYGAAAMNLVRLGGAATVISLAGFIFIMIRRERTAGN